MPSSAAPAHVGRDVEVLEQEESQRLLRDVHDETAPGEVGDFERGRAKRRASGVAMRPFGNATVSGSVMRSPDGSFQAQRESDGGPGEPKAA